jgi:hypothetical protein
MSTVKTITSFRFFAVAALFVIALGCSPAPDRGAEVVDETNDTAAVLTPEERAERREALSREWQSARDRLEEVRQKATADNIQDEWDDTVAKIDTEAADVRRELDEFQEDSRQAWNDFEARVDRSLESIGQQIDAAVEHFN